MHLCVEIVTLGGFYRELSSLFGVNEEVMDGEEVQALVPRRLIIKLIWKEIRTINFTKFGNFS